MSILADIRPELTRMVEAMQAVAGIDITVVDPSLLRVAGTGPLAAEVGRHAPVGSAFEQCLRTGLQFFIERPTRDAACQTCARRHSCRELAELCIPIKLEGDTIGVLGLCAFDETSARALLAGREDYARFEAQLSEHIASLLNERRYGRLVEYRSSQLTTLLNALEEGIILLSSDEAILTINRYLLSRLHLDAQRLPPLVELLGPAVRDQLAAADWSGEVGPVGLAGHSYLITASPIVLESERQGVVLVLSDFGKMQRSVLKASRSGGLVRFDDIIGQSEALRAARRQAALVAAQDASVLLSGETGTGKEVFARAIHAASRRAAGLFMPVNCAAIPEALIESELFGYEKGAFTGAATSGKLGLFELCKDGTLFLDEIGDLPLSTQVKLLRALEEKEIIRVGGTVPLRVDPRVVAASHRDLTAMVAEGRFREDLFYRLNVVPIAIPPLRERGGDVLLLARHFLAQFCAAYDRTLTGFSPACERLLLRHRFPGNIRELRNLVEYAVIFEPGTQIEAETLASKLDGEADRRRLSELTRAYEREVIERQLAATDGSLEAKRAVADALGISLTTLYRKRGIEEAGDRLHE